MERITTEFRLVFDTSDQRRINEIYTKIASRAAEMGGLLDIGVTIIPPEVATSDELPREVGEDEAAYSARKARHERDQREATRSDVAIESPITKFGRAFGGDGH